VIAANVMKKIVKKGAKDGAGNGEEVFPSPSDWGYAGAVSSHSGPF